MHGPFACIIFFLILSQFLIWKSSQSEKSKIHTLLEAIGHTQAI